jgi:hypothetical protein
MGKSVLHYRRKMEAAVETAFGVTFAKVKAWRSPSNTLLYSITCKFCSSTGFNFRIAEGKEFDSALRCWTAHVVAIHQVDGVRVPDVELSSEDVELATRSFIRHAHTVFAVSFLRQAMQKRS